MDRLQLKDYKKPNYVIMRKVPDGSEVIISGTFTVKENAIKEVKERIKRYRDILATGKNQYGANVNLEEFKQWGEPYLVEVKLEMNKVEVE